MKTCKDCIHFKDVCEEHGLYFENEYLKNVAFSENIKDLCHGFKDKADFVEVVRCEKCKHGDVSCHAKTKDGEETIACYCHLKKAVTDVDSYCPSGERREK